MSRLSILTINIVLILLLAGCGSKGPVKPLLKEVPSVVGNVSLVQRGEVMQLSWTSPRSNEDGSPITALTGFHVYRWVHSQETFCSECRDESQLWHVIDIEYPENVRVDGDKYTIFDVDTVLGEVHRYRVHPVTGGGVEGKAVKVSSLFMTPHPAPYVETTVLEGVVRIAWQRFGEDKIAGFRVYRQHPDTYTPTLLYTAGADELSYDDLRVESGVRYLYFVRAIDADGNEGLSSELIEAVIP